MEGFPRLLGAVFHDEPSNGFRQSKGAEQEETAGDHLQTHGYLPFGRSPGDAFVGRHTVVDPVGEEDAPGVHPLVEGATPTADFFGRHLGAVHGDGDTLGAHAQTRDHACHVPTREVTGVDGLDDDAEHEHGRRADDGPFAAKFVDNGEGEAGRDEGSELFQSHRERGNLGLLTLAVVKVGLEGFETEDTSRDTGVVAGQERRDAV